MGLTTDNLKIALSENPKEITCKGVLSADINNDITNCPMVFWLGGNNDSIWSKALNKNTDIPDTPYYRDLKKDNIKSLIEDSINDFFSLLDDYFKQINFGNFKPSQTISVHYHLTNLYEGCRTVKRGNPFFGSIRKASKISSPILRVFWRKIRYYLFSLLP